MSPIPLRALVVATPVLLLVLGGMGTERAPHLPVVAAAGPGSPEWVVDRDGSTLAIVTFRAGVAGRLAHDHLVHAGDFEAELAFDPDEPESARFSGHVLARDLVVDDPDRKDRVEPLLHEMELLRRDLPRLDESTRADVRESMLDEDQLHAEEHPEIRFRLVSVEAAAQEADAPWDVTVELEVRGRSHSRTLAGSWEEADDGELRIRVGGEFRFTDFEIEPYSAFLRTVRNDDPFVLFLDLRARPAG